MTKINDNYTISDIKETVSSYLNDDNLTLIDDSYDYVQDKLDEVDNKYILNVSYILTTVYADSETIAACFISKLYSKNMADRNDLEKIFPLSVIRLAYGIYKLNKISLSTENDYLIDYYKKVIVGMSEDVRVIIVAISERVYLMRELYNVPVDKQKLTAKETLTIFAPIAHHLGIYRLKSELEDLSLRYLKPDVFYDIAEKLNTTKTYRDNIINEMMNEVSNILIDHNIKHEIKGRSKSIYSIYNKLDRGRKFSDIYDLLALRILVDNEAECYLVLGLIHSKFKPITKRFKDFIAMPKPNGYQSLHTTVFGINNELFEIQIRTYEMNEVAENGLASHWSYKENKNAENLSGVDAKLGFFKAVIDMNKDHINSEEIYDTIKEDSSENNIYVFTPKGDVIELPKGSTPVDFAYRVHSNIGDSMVGALVNNTIVPLNYELQDNDVVKINTSKSSIGPSEDWLSFVKLTQTKNKIKAYFTKNRKDEFISIGKEALEKELKKRKIVFSDFYDNKNIKKVCKELKLSDLNTIYLTIGNNKNNIKDVLEIVYPTTIEEDNNLVSRIVKNNELDINVGGIKDVKVNIASCCNPVPGDRIVGYITKNNGITVHRDICHNLIHLDERMVDVYWNKITKNKYTSILFIILKNGINNKMVDIANRITNKSINIDSISTIYKDSIVIYKVDIYINNKDSLDKIITELIKLKYIEQIERGLK